MKAVAPLSTPRHPFQSFLEEMDSADIYGDEFSKIRQGGNNAAAKRHSLFLSGVSMNSGRGAGGLWCMNDEAKT